MHKGFPADEKEPVFTKGAGHCGLPRENLSSEEPGLESSAAVMTIPLLSPWDSIYPSVRWGGRTSPEFYWLQQEPWTGKERTLEASHPRLLACFRPPPDNYLLASQSLRFPTARYRSFRPSSCHLSSLGYHLQCLPQGKPGLLSWQNPMSTWFVLEATGTICSHFWSLIFWCRRAR